MMVASTEQSVLVHFFGGAELGLLDPELVFARTTLSRSIEVTG